MENRQAFNFNTIALKSAPVQSFLPYIDAVVMTIVTFLGILRVPEPFWRDQVPFMMFAERFASGALLYRDLWDIKPPGIYGVYLVAGKLFGFTSMGMHLFDGLWMVALAVVLRLTLAHYFTRSWIAQVVPWLSVGLYFTVLDPNDQMQVESLIGLPIYGLIWCTWQATQQSAQNPEKRWKWLFLSGIAGGVVVLFKLIFLPLIVGFWLIYLLHSLVRQKQLFWAAIGQSVPPVLLGILMPIGPVLLYWVSQQMLPEAYQTVVLHPVQMMKNLPKRPITTLITSIFSWMRRFAPVTILAGVAIAHLIRSKRLDFLMTQMIVWLGLGLVTISVQTQSWWRYHFFLLLVPIAILAAKGIDLALQPHARGGVWNRRIVAVCLLGMVGLNLLAVGRIGTAMARSGLPLTAETQLAYHKQTSLNYSSAAAAAKLLNEPGRKPGPVYVIGDPTVYILAHRTQAIPLLGTIATILLPEQWILMQHQLEAAHPAYLYIKKTDLKDIPSTFLAFVNRQYQSIQTIEDGTWYEERA